MNRTTPSIRHSLAALLCVALPACKVGPDYKPASAASLAVPERFTAAGTQVGEEALAGWWRSFNDADLDWLVERAVASNLDIDAAGARLRAARALVRAARAPLFPSLGVSASATRNWQRNSRSTAAGSAAAGATQYAAGFDASYEVDLFGGVRRSIEAARADAQSSEANLHDVQRSVVAEVALDYLDLRASQARRQIAQDNLAAQDETLQIVGWRVQAGLASSLDLAQAQALRAQTAATIPALDTTIAVDGNALAVLLGMAPGTIGPRLAARRPIPSAPSELLADFPTRVIARRPDVRAAERKLAAETARIGVQEARLYPALQLSGTLSGAAGSIGNLTQFAAGSLVAAIAAPIFEGGAIRAGIEQQRATTVAAFDTYRLAVLTALQDVEDALARLAGANRRERELAAAAAASADAATFARLQYRSGLIDFERLLDAERTLLANQDALATAQADRSTGLIQLYKALGGGWQGAPLPASARGGGESAAGIAAASDPRRK